MSADVLPLGDGAGAGWAQVPRPKNQGAGGGAILSRGWGMGSAYLQATAGQSPYM